MVADNVFSVIRAALDRVNDKPVSQDLSSDCIAHEIAATFRALLLLSEAADWRSLATGSPGHFAQWLSDVAGNVRLQTVRKHGRGPKKPKPKPLYDPEHPYVSIYKLIQEQP